jgi:hypothetical protein
VSGSPPYDRDGDEHFREAQRLLASAESFGVLSDVARDRVAKAQVHATMALAAATMDAAFTCPEHGLNYAERVREGYGRTWPTSSPKADPVPPAKDPEAGQLAVFLAAVVAIVGLWLLLIAAGLSLRGLG